MRCFAIVSCLALAACGDNERLQLPWAIGVATFDNFAPASAPVAPWLAAITPHRRLETPTYDGSGQATHPDMLVENDRGILALTPYEFSNDRLENPSVLVTSDGIDFAPAPGAPAPLVPAPAYDHNNDPDLHRDPNTGELELLYLETLRPDKQTLVALRTRDLVQWQRRDAIVWDFHAKDPFVVSPAAIVDAAGTTHLFFVQLGDGNNFVQELASTDGLAWDRTAQRGVMLDLGTVIPWHLDVIPAGSPGAYAMLISGYPRDGAFVHQNLYVATSRDEMATWQLAPAPLLRYDDPKLELATLYRSTGIVSGGRLIIWYAMQYEP